MQSINTLLIRKQGDVVKYLFVFCLIFFLFHCTSVEKETVSAKSLFQKAQAQTQRGYYEEAGEVILKLKYQFSHSEYVAQADLLKADMFFDQREFLEAQKSYRNFIHLYPRHKDERYAFYRQILSGSHRVPKESDRDLSVSDEVLSMIDNFLKQNKNKKYLKEVKDIQLSLHSRKAEKEFKIVQFYFKKNKISKETLNRLDQVINNYSQTSFYSKALDLALQIAQKLDDQKKVQIYLSKIRKLKS